jgi:hypothetical protein
VDPIAGTTKAAQALRPGGALAMFWHVFEPPPAVNAAFAAVYRRVAPDSPVTVQTGGRAVDLYQRMLTRAADGMREVGGFDDPTRSRFDWERYYTSQEWLDLLPTTGGLTRLPADELAEVQAAVGAAIDATGGGFTMSYTTLAIIARKAGK